MKLNDAICKSQICQSFSKQAECYETSAVVQREIGDRMFERLTYLKMKPQRVLDLGCGSGYFSQKLQQFYAGAQVVGLDFSWPMLQQAQLKQHPPRDVRSGVSCPWALTCADFSSLPFADSVFDLVFANQVIHWTSDYGGLFQEIQRVLKPEGCFLFSTLGPDTFKELNRAWETVDRFLHTHSFVDMHVIGDELLRQKFLDPVIDREDLCVHYPSLAELLRSLKAQGVRNMNPARNPGLTTPSTWRQFEQAYAQFLTQEQYAPLSYEIVQGHAWKGQTHHGKNGQEVWLSIGR